MDLRNGIDDAFRNGGTIKFERPIGRLIHEPTGINIIVHKPIPRFKTFMLKWCFGLKYERYDKRTD